MGDIQFKNRADVKWFDLFDSYFIQTNVSTDTGAEMDLGSTEVLMGKSNSKTSASGLLSLGVVEILGSSTPSVSSGIADLELGKEETISSSINISSLVVSYLTMGVAEGLFSTSFIKSNVDVFLNLGTNELLGSVVISNSIVGSLMTLGVETLMTTRQNVISKTSFPELVIGLPEALSGKSISSITTSSNMILGFEESLFSECNIFSDSLAELSLGSIENLSSNILCESFTDSLLSLGVIELLGSTSTIISIAPELLLDIGKDEHLTFSLLINTSVSTTELNLGISESLSSSITLESIVNNTFTVGIVEILGGAIPSTAVATNANLILGTSELLSSACLVESNISSFLILGTTETLSSKIKAQSFIRKGGEWSTLTIGHVELLAHKVRALSVVDYTTLNIGREEILSYTNHKIQSTTSAVMLIGVVELLSSAQATSVSAYDADLTIGIENKLSSSIRIDSSCSSFILMGLTESLSSSINIKTSITSNLVKGQIELLASSVFSITIIDSVIDIGGSEIQVGTSSVQSKTYAVLVLGNVEELSHTINTESYITSNIDSSITIGELSVLSSSKATSSTTIATLRLGKLESLSSSVSFSSDINSILILGITEKLKVTTETITTTSTSDLNIGRVEAMYSTSINESNIEGVLTTGFSEELSGASFILSDVDSILSIGIIEVLLSTITSVTTSSASNLITGQLEILASSTFSITVLNSYVTTGIVEPLSSTISIENLISGHLIEGGGELLQGKSILVSFIRKGGKYSSLTIGIKEILSGSSKAKTNIIEPSIILGIPESLSSTYYSLGKIFVNASLTLGKVEVLGKSESINTVVNSELTLGTIEPLSASSYIKSLTDSSITFGEENSLSSFINITSEVDSSIILGVVELIASTVATTSNVVLEMFIGNDESLSGSSLLNSIVTTYLTLGIANQIRSSIVITTSIASDVYLGVAEPSSSSIFIINRTNNPTLVLGVNELMSSHPYIETKTVSRLGVGILEVIAAASTSHSILPGNLTIGIIEELESNNIIEFNISADLTLGDITILEGSVSVVSNIQSLLLIGKVEILSTSNFSVSLLDSYIVLGSDESLTHTSIIESSSSANLTLGVIEVLESTENIISNVVNALLSIGVTELLATSNFSITITEADLTFGEENPLKGITYTQSYISDSQLIIGVSELLASITASTLHFPPAELVIGIGEILSATCLVQATVSDVLNLGGDESLSSGITFSHLVESNIDLVIGGPVPLSGKINSKTFVRATWIYIPGALEELESSIFISTYVHKASIYRETELLSSNPNIISNAITTLSLGVIEIASSSNFSISIVASTLDIGIGYDLKSTNNIVSNTTAGNLIIGIEEDLSVFQTLVKTNINADLILGVVELTSSSSFTISITDAALLQGRIEVLSAKPKAVSKTKGFVSIPGTLELLESSALARVFILNAPLDVEYISLGEATCYVQSSVESSLDNGDNEELESRVFILTGADVDTLDIGISTVSNGNCIIVSNVEADLYKPQILESSCGISIRVLSYIDMGDFTEITSTIGIISVAEGILNSGEETGLSASVHITDRIDASYLVNPVIWIRSSVNNISSIVQGGYIDINGVISLSATNTIKVNVDSILTNGIESQLESSILAESYVSDSIFAVGVVELLASSVFSVSIIDSVLTNQCVYLHSTIDIQVDTDNNHLSAPEHLIGSSTITSKTYGNIIPGLIEIVTAEENIFTTISVAELTIGSIEELSSTIDIVSLIEEVNLTSNIFLKVPIDYVWNKVVSITSTPKIYITNGYFSSTCEISSFTTFELELTLGRTEPLISYIQCISDVSQPIIEIGLPTELISSVLVRHNVSARLDVADLRGKSKSENETWGTLTLGVSEDLRSKYCKVKSNIVVPTIMVGGLDFYATSYVNTISESLLQARYKLLATSLIESDSTVDLSIGILNPISSSVNIISKTLDGKLTLGINTPLTSKSNIRFRVSGVITIGTEHSLKSKLNIKTSVTNEFLFVGDKNALFSQSRSKSTVITPYLTTGSEKELLSSVNISTSYTESNLILGVVELISTSAVSNSTSAALMKLGKDNELSSIILIESNASSYVLIGSVETLTSTVYASTYAFIQDALSNDTTLKGTSHITNRAEALDLTTGSLTPLTGHSMIRSSFVIEYISGNVERLNGTVFIENTGIASIVVGYKERLSASIIVLSNVDDLDFGETIEFISSTSHIKLSINGFINTGVNERLASTSISESFVRSIDLIFGIAETLTSSSIITVESEASSIALDIEHISRITIQSNILDSELTIGAVEELSGTALIIVNSVTNAVIFGADEALSSTSRLTSKIVARLSFGFTEESLNSFISIQSNVVTTSSLVIDTIDRYNRRITADLQYWYDHFVVNHKTLNSHKLPFPSSNQEYEGSFVELLFNDEYKESSYRYLYRKVDDRYVWPDAIRSRMMLNPDTARYYIADGDDPNLYNVNIYNIKSHDIIMLDRLLVYRLEPQHTTLVGIDYDSLDSALAKMIYIYLELKLTGNYSKYDNTAIFTTHTNVLETCYETYLTQNVFEHVSSKGT